MNLSFLQVEFESLDSDLTVQVRSLFCLFDLILYVPSTIFQL